MGLSIYPKLMSMCLFIAGLLFSGCALVNDTRLPPFHASLATSIIKSPNDNRQYDSITLNNQLEIVLVSDPSITKSAAAISVGVGSFQEPAEFAGLAHYLEHMLFMGTQSYPDVGGYSEFVSRNGGTQNAYTELDHTNYMVAVNNDAFEEALSRFSGFFYEASLDASYAEKERNAVHSEWSMKSPNDWVILEQLNGLHLNPAHPISRFSWGNLDTLADNKQQSLQAELVKFYNTYYSANLMKGSLISPLPIAELKALAIKHFTKISNKNVPKSTVKPRVSLPENLNKIVHYVPQTDIKQLQVKFVIDNNSDQFTVKPNGYIEYLLNNEMPGTLASELRNAGLSEAVYSSYDADKYSNAGDFTLYVDLTQSGVERRDEVMAAIVGYLTLLKEKGVNEKYYSEIKQSLNNRFRFAEKSNDYDYAMQIAANLQTLPKEYVLSSAYEYQRFDPTAIRDVLQQLSLANARVFYIDKNQAVEQKMQFFSGQYSSTDISPEVLSKWQQLSTLFNLSLPRENKLMPQSFAVLPITADGKPKHLIAEDGFNLHLAHSALFSQPKGLVFIDFNTGLSKATARNHVLSSILTRGLNQQLTALQLESYVAGMGMNVEVANGLSFNVSGFTDQQTILIERMLHQVLIFTLSKEEFANHIASFKSEIESRSKQILFDQLFPKYRKVLNLDNYSDKAILQEVDSITLSELLAFRDALLEKANVNMLVFGNYKPQEAKEMANLVLSILPENRKPSSFYLSPELNVQAGEVYNWQQDINMTDVAMVDTYLAPLSIEALAAAQVLSQIIQAPLFAQIRTEEQLAYAVGFFSQKINKQLLLGYYIQSPVQGLAVIDTRIRQFRRRFMLHLIDLSENEFNDVKHSVLTTLLQPAKNLTDEVVNVLEDWRQQNFNFDGKEKFVNAVEKLKHEDVINLYRQIESGQKFGRLMIQLRGNNFSDVGFVSLENATPVRDVDEFHKNLRR